MGFRFCTLQKKIGSAELVKLGISIYFWLGNSPKKSRLAFFSSFKILLNTSLEPLEKSFSSNFAFCTVECSRARRILRRSNYLKRAVFHLRFSFSKLSASFHESFTKAVHIAWDERRRRSSRVCATWALLQLLSCKPFFSRGQPAWFFCSTR